MKKNSWTYTTKKSSRRYGLALFVGVVAGLASGVVKLGWEVMFPPRVPKRVTPPQVLLEKAGVNVKDMTYTFSGHKMNYGNFIVHFGFSIATVALYSLAAEIWPKSKLGQGSAAGLAYWAGAHLAIMPMMGLTPRASDLPRDEQISEIFGHMAWLWTAEVFRRDLRNRITQGPDPEF